MEAKTSDMELTEKPKGEVINIDLSGGILPSNYNELLQFAALYKKSGLAPKSLQTVEQIAIATGMCLELNRPILTGLQDFAVINGKVAIYGDAALAIVRASGLLEEFEETESGTPYEDDWTFTCLIKRKGAKKPRIGKWTWIDTKRAGFDHPKTKDGRQDIWSPWSRFTRRMMQFKARNFPLRDEFGDVIKGMTLAEDAQDIIDVTPEQGNSLKIEGKETPEDGKNIYEVKKKEEVPAEEKEQIDGETREIVDTGTPEEIEAMPTLFELLKGMRPSTSPENMDKWKKAITENADAIRAMPKDEYNYIGRKWNKACPGYRFPAAPIVEETQETEEPGPQDVPASEQCPSTAMEDIENGYKEKKARFEKEMGEIVGIIDLNEFQKELSEKYFVSDYLHLPEEEWENAVNHFSRLIDNKESE